MAFVLAGAIFYVIGTGNAIIYRERLQDTSDAIAYSAAGVHARGMNLIVLINLIDVALLAILASLRLLSTMFHITLGTCAVVAGTAASPNAPFCGPFEGWALPIEDKLGSAVQSYAQVVDTVLPVLSKTQDAIAKTTAHVALAKAVKVSDKNDSASGGGVVKAGVMVSPSLIPGHARKGLPIEDMDATTACLEAAELGRDMALFWTPSFAEQAMTWAAGGVAENFPGFYCGNDSSAALKKELHDSFKALAKELCAEKQKKHDEAHEKNLTPPPFDVDECRKDELKALKKKSDAALESAPNLSGGRVPKQIHGPATIGGDWFQVWGVAFGDEKWPRNLDRGIALAAAAGLTVPTSGFGDYRFAQAEFFWDGSGEWTDNRSLSLWQMRWQTRLRRVRLEGDDVRETFDEYGVQRLSQELGARVGVVHRPRILTFLGALTGGFRFPVAQAWLDQELAQSGYALEPEVVH